ncbi:MAG: PD40 domain-containing protein [Bacteroidales bacterium]|nr:PD40 domain-containing protein [Bacteroidales bacterium]
MWKKLFFSFLILIGFRQTLQGQFYNGHQMDFGKNRVQYNDFYWQFNRYDKYDVYFNQDGKQLAEYTADFAENEISRIENFFDYRLDKRIIFVVYNKLSDFRQSNIGLVTGKVDYNIGGVTNISKNKVFLFFEGDYTKFEVQIRAAVAEVLINELLYGSQLKDNVTNSTLLNLPEWYIKGLISYVSDHWNFDLENKVKDGIQTGKYTKFNRLIGEDAVYAGHSFWRFIAETYGESVIPNIIYLTRVNKNSKSGFLYVLGLSLKDLSSEWKEYYLNQFTAGENQENFPDTDPLIKKPKRRVVYQQVKINPLGKYVAYVSNKMGKYKIWLYNSETGKSKKIIRKEHSLEQITDYSYPILAWHPSGRILTFFTEEKGGIKFYYYTLATKEFEVRNFLYFDKILDASFSHDGTYLVLSAVQNGKTDIFVHNLASATNQQITNDIADDFHPRFVNNSKQIIFSSNRKSDSLDIEASNSGHELVQDLFIYDFAAKSGAVMRLSDYKYVNKFMPYEVAANKFISLNDMSGIINRYYSQFDSTISFVDTTVHYRYYAKTNPLTNYSRNILEQDYNSKTNTLGEVIFNKSRYYLYNYPLQTDILPDNQNEFTAFRRIKTSELIIEDSVRNVQKEKIGIEDIKDNVLITEKDTITFDPFPIDVNNYVFEQEKLNYYNEQIRGKNLDLVLDTSDSKRQRPRIYQTAFYQNFIVNQVDFSFLNNSYQAFTGGAVYFNPGMNVLTKIGTNDLFEDYKITGGFRLPVDFDSNEYLISIENLKHRLNKQFIFHRQTFKNTTQNAETIKTQTNEISLVFRYPFNQVASWLRTFTFRNDRTVFLSTEASMLNKPDIFKTWVGIKMEYIFDNTHSLGKNLYSGTRYKFFGELYQQVNGNFDNLAIVGVDFRNYFKIHRNLIWANRFAASTNFGSSRLIYYLGGVDNWTNITPLKTPTFIPLNEIRIDETKNYVYQTVATNMRGFSQNIRNGTSFALFNSEIRWPVIKYLANFPISNSFLENFQVVGFFDIGTAWSGPHPWAKQNAYDNDIIERNPITIIIDANRDPIVAGYGFGVRSQLFGYFIRLDWAWGIENYELLPRVFYLSLSLDF